MTVSDSTPSAYPRWGSMVTVWSPASQSSGRLANQPSTSMALRPSNDVEKTAGGDVDADHVGGVAGCPDLSRNPKGLPAGRRYA